MKPDRYARQRMIAWWRQDRLSTATVLVAGVGALGNEVAKNLALLGVGRLVLVDFDRVEPSNLSRAVLFDDHSVGAPKVKAAAAALARLNPEVAVQTIEGDVFHDVGLGWYRHSQLAIGCLDNLAARSQVGLSCALAGIPHLDGGMWALGGEVRWFNSGEGPCFDCTLAPDDWQRATERRSCSGFASSDPSEPAGAPTLATTAAIVGGLLAQEAAKWLCGQPVPMGKALVYNGQALTLHRAELTRNPACRSSHQSYQAVESLPVKAAETTPRALLELARNGSPKEGFSLELGRDFLLALHCPNCGRHDEINRLWAKVPETERTCPHCGTTRQGETIHTIEPDTPWADRSLATLGVPPTEVLAVSTPAGLRFYELSGDATARSSTRSDSEKTKQESL